MADISLVTADKVQIVGVPVVQHTAPAGEAITAGAPVLFNSSGKFINSDPNASGKEATGGTATHTVASGETLTAIRDGKMDGWDLSGLAYGDPVYASDTVGRLAD